MERGACALQWHSFCYPWEKSVGMSSGIR